MDIVLFQFLNEGPVSLIFFMIFWAIFFFFYPRLMLTQIMWKLERTANNLETMSKRSKLFIIKNISKNPSKELKESVNRFFEFFMIQPVSLDPAGIVGKFDHIIQGQRQKFRYFVKQIAPHLNKERQANIRMGLAGGITVHEIAKIVRHYVELVRQTKSFQIAMIIQMQLPLIEKIATAVYQGTKSLTKGEPIGDGLGPLAAAHLIGSNKVVEVEDNILMAKTKMDGRDIIILKAKGPGGRLGSPGKAVEKVISKTRVVKVITIDAAAKLEGERTGSLAEGVGVAMGGPGVERTYIEDVVTKKDIPLDSIVVKMSGEEAMMPMKKEIKDAIPEVKKSVKRSLKSTTGRGSVLIVGVGNTSGIGNSLKDARKTEEWVEKHHKKITALKKKKRGQKDPSIWDANFGTSIMNRIHPLVLEGFKLRI